MTYFDLFLLFVLSLLLSLLLYQLATRYDRVRRLQKMTALLGTRKAQDEHNLIKEQQRRIHYLQARIERQLRLAGITLSPLALALLYVPFAALCAALFVFYLGSYGGVTVGIVLSAAAAYMGIAMLIRRRHRAFNIALASAITVLVKMMKNGIGFEQALQKAVEVSTCSLFRRLFTRFLHEKNTVGEEAAFANVDRYIDSKELRIFAIAVKIGRASGGRFSQTLEKVEMTIRHRKRMHDRIGVITREANIGSYIIAAIGVLLYGMLDFNFNGKVTEYFMTSPYGRWQLLGIVGWIAVGLVINRIITRIKI